MALGTYFAEKLRRSNFNSFTQWYCESLIIGSLLLIFPMLIVGVYFDKLLNRVVFAYFALSLFFLLYYIIRITKSIYPKQINSIFFQSRYKDKFLIFLLIFLLLDYTFINFIYPPRGWDALHFYFPNMRYFYLGDDIIAGLNPLNFYPTFKPPANVLFLTYFSYISTGFTSELMPITFLLGITLLCILFADELGINRKIGYYAALVLLTTPAVYMTILEYAYYQELPLTFFYSSGMIYFYKARKNDSYYDYFVASIGFGLASVSKMSGYSFPILLLICFSLPLGRWEKYIRSLILLILIVLLSRKAIFDSYIGIGLFLITIGILIIIQILQNNELVLIDKNKRKVLSGYFLSTVALIILGGTWIIHMLKIPDVVDTLVKFYFQTERSSISWRFNNIDILGEISVENAHVVSFWSTILVIFIGSQFSLFLLLPKVVGIVSAKKDFPILNIWIGVFYILWLAYYSTTSIRYLSVIWIPLSIISVLGISKLITHFEMSDFEDIIFLFIIACNFLFFYPFIPLEYSNEGFHQRYKSYHLSIFRLLIYTIFFVFIIILLFRGLSKLAKQYKKTNLNNHNFIKIITYVLIIIISLSPIAFQSSELISNGFDIGNFREENVYDNRKSVMDLVDFIKSEKIESDEIIIVVNLPGLEYFTNNMVIDLYLTTSYLDSNQLSAITDSNLTRAFGELISNNVRYVITLLSDHAFYEVYVNRYVKTYPFLSSIAPNFGLQVFYNNEFVVWKLFR